LSACPNCSLVRYRDRPLATLAEFDNANPPAIWRVFAWINLPNHPKQLAQDLHTPNLAAFSTAR
jgi:hypothetical protein